MKTTKARTNCELGGWIGPGKEVEWALDSADRRRRLRYLLISLARSLAVIIYLK